MICLQMTSLDALTPFRKQRTNVHGELEKGELLTSGFASVLDKAWVEREVGFVARSPHAVVDCKAAKLVRSTKHPRTPVLVVFAR